MSNLVDSYERSFYYLRLSITNVCNFRCDYCLPNGYKPSPRTFLNLDEIKRLLTAFSELGIQKVRLTGGEPTLRKDFLEIAKLVHSFPVIKKRAFTTNGYRLKKFAQEYYDAGLNAINISADSLNPKTFHALTKHDVLKDVLSGIDNAMAAGFDSIKINAVLLKGVNDTELDVFLNYVKKQPVTIRFIELMQTGINLDYFSKYHIKANTIMDQLLAVGWQQKKQDIDAGPAIELSHTDYIGNIGFITPYDKNFCTTCNRLRVSSYGDLHLCLFGDVNYSIRHLLQNDESIDALKQHLIKLVQHKRKSHFLQDGDFGITPHLASIGG